MFKVNKKTPEQGHCCSGVFIVDFEYISHIVLFPLLTLNMQMFAGSVFYSRSRIPESTEIHGHIADSEQRIVCWIGGKCVKHELAYLFLILS